MEQLFSDSQWMLATSLLVSGVPVGLLVVERASARGAGALLGASRVLMDLAIAVLATCLVGFAWVHGPSLAGVLGLAPGPAEVGGPLAPWRAAVVLWHALAVGAAVVLAGSGGAERARPVCSALAAALLALLVLPLVGHWAWGGRPEGVALGWLGRIGFVDQGGAVVLHVVGGAGGLALASVLGPRRGRYDGLGRPRPPMVREPWLESVGTVLMVVGCLGLLGGGRLGWRAELPGGLFNGLVGAASGLLAAAAAGAGSAARPTARTLRLGAVAGVVAVSGGALSGGPGWAAVAGAVGGALAPAIDRRVLAAGIDDTAGVAGAHLGAGAWGALAAAFVVQGPGLPLRIAVQGTGALVAAAAAFGIVHVVLAAVDRRLPLRISPFSEEVGSGLVQAVLHPFEATASGRPTREGD